MATTWRARGHSHPDSALAIAAPTPLAPRAARPPTAGAGAVGPLRSHREGPPARAPQAAFPPRGRAGPAAPALYPFAPPLQIWAHSATRDNCQYPRWRPRPGPAGSPPQPQPLRASARRTGTGSGPLSGRGAALWDCRVGLTRTNARVYSHYPPHFPALSQPRSA